MNAIRGSLFSQFVLWILVLTMTMTAFIPAQAMAGFIPSTEILGNMSTEPIQDLDKVKGVLESRLVQQRLQDWGLSAEEVLQRLQDLSPRQIHQLATHLDEIQTGGDSGLGILVSLLVIAILVVVLIQLSGHRIVIR